MSGRHEEGLQRHAETFVSCRVGLELRQYDQELRTIIERHDIGGKHGDFIITPMVSPRLVHDGTSDDLNLMPDMVLEPQEWENKVAVSIDYQPIKGNPDSEQKFSSLLCHAMYLPVQVIIIECPIDQSTQEIVATIVNEKTYKKTGKPLILFRIQLGSTDRYTEEEERNLGLNIDTMTDVELYQQNSQDSNSGESGLGRGNSESPNLVKTDKSERIGQQLIGMRNGFFIDDWARWNSLRQKLKPDHRIGVCLALQEEVEFEIGGSLKRWHGEPVRMFSLSTDWFVSSPTCTDSMRLSGSLKEFIREIMLANSFQSAVVVQAMPNKNMEPYLKSLSFLCANLDKEHPDYLRGWNDSLMTPLQPLATNLDSRTYQVFELDRIKYIKYQEAMMEALDYIMMKPETRNKDQLHLMVLGAGRGPLVDAMINAITNLKLRKKCKIFALDKNQSSVQSLRYKQVHNWSKMAPLIETEVVRADMRFWQAPAKADLIATELLGSLSDNELSPECIDGTWRLATPKTISIPESYTSFIAPVSSFKIHQEISSGIIHAYDQIYVVRLSNIHTISEPRPLFTYEHRDLSKQPTPGANQRKQTMIFKTEYDTVCHGFAGYFAAKLFGSTTISTVPSFKTESMDSWFPAYIPLEEPVLLAAGSEIELFFSRKESDTHVWYEWQVIRPILSRLHSQASNNSAMSKIV